MAGGAELDVLIFSRDGACRLDLLLQAFEAVQLGGDRGAFFQQGLAIFGGIPEAGTGNDALQFLEASLKGRQVKDTP